MGARYVNAFLAVMATCAVVTTGLVVRRELWPDVPAPPARVGIADDWKEYVRGNRIGPEDAAVRVVVFSDAQCPACALAWERLRQLRLRHPDEVSLHYRHFPLPAHPHAVDAARAGECAAVQNRFEAYHDALFADQRSIGRRPWTAFATASGVGDTAAFRICMVGEESLAAVARDTLDGNRLGVQATPTILINRFRIRGVVPLDTMSAYVLRALREGRGFPPPPAGEGT